MNRIYNLDCGVIDVYEIIPKNAKLKEFRNRQINIIPEEERVLTRNDNINWFTKKERYPVLYSGYGLEIENKKDNDLNKEILDKYVNGEYEESKIKKHTRIDKNEFLYTLEANDDFSNKYIQLSKKAYILELLQRQRFQDEDLLDSNLDFLNELIDISSNPVARLDFKTLVFYHNSGLIDNSFDKTLDIVEDSSKVYKKIRTTEK